MLKFNNDSIITGYIKQLLTSFNLPKYRIYTKENQEYFNKYGKESPEIICTIKKIDTSYPEHMRYVHYIKDGYIQDYVHTEKANGDTISHEWVNTGKKFSYDVADTNFTRNLKITNNIYDSYTHEYLGDYLRFLREYNNINLMSFYNCFSNRVCSRLNYTWTYLGSQKTVTFDTDDLKYKIYMFPVKLFKKYTIAIDSSSPVEICCGIYGKYQDTRIKLADIPELTYVKYGDMKFNKPVLFDKLLDLAELTRGTSKVEIAQNEEDLKMFIKLPVTNTSSIVVLEGDYLNFNDTILRKESNGDRIIIAADKDKTIEASDFEPTESGVQYWLCGDDDPILSEKKEPDDWTYLYTFNGYTYNESGAQEKEKVLFIESGRILKEYKEPAKKFTRKQNHFITNYENYFEGQYFKPITPLQLLRINTKFSYPFADRLIEYLVGNVITSEDEISDNIVRTQTVMKFNKVSTKYPGIWESKMNPVLYDYMNKDGVLNTNDLNHDILGYVDKDTEHAYEGTDSKGNTYSIASVDIYPDLYIDSKEDN